MDSGSSILRPDRLFLFRRLDSKERARGLLQGWQRFVSAQMGPAECRSCGLCSKTDVLSGRLDFEIEQLRFSDETRSE